MINSYKFLFLFMIAIGLESLNLQALQAQSIFPDKIWKRLYVGMFLPNVTMKSL